MELLYKKETKILRGLIYEVRNELGGGWSEEIYHQALLHNLAENKIPFQSKPRFPLTHRETEVYSFEPDVVVWDKIILELKVLPKFKDKNFPSENEAQIIQYLKRFEKKLGMLVNFAPSRVGIKRMAYEPPKMEVSEDYERIKGKLAEPDRKLLQRIREVILEFGQTYGTGYSERVYRSLLALEFIDKSIKCNREVQLCPSWKNQKLGTQYTNHLLVEDKFLILVKSAIDHPSAYDFIQTQSFLEALNLSVGLVLNFGKNKFQIIGTAVNQTHQRSSLSASLNMNQIGDS
ncbi:MAG: GxxExxY protein [Chloroflexota bacterium]